MSCDNFTSVNGTLPSRHPYTIETSAPLTIMVAVLILLIVFGNVLVVMAVTTSRALRAPQNLFLVSLACADILVATLVMPFSLANELMGYWYFGQIWCEIYLALDVLFCTSSIVHLCAIGMDRYWSISQAIEYNAKRTPCRIKCIVFIVWVLAAMISFPPLITMEKEAGKEDGPRCEINKQKWYIIFSSTASFFAPCVIMILVYVRIYQIAKKRTRGPPGARRKDNGSSDDRQPESAPRDGNNVEGGQLKVDGGGGVKEIVLEGECSSSDGNEHSQCSCTKWRAVRKSKATHVNPDEVQVGRRRARQNRDKRFTFVLAVVMGVFVICWFPFFFTYTLKAMCDSCCVPETLFKMFFWFGYCNSSLNPVIYTVFNKDFQRAFKKIIC